MLPNVLWKILLSLSLIVRHWYCAQKLRRFRIDVVRGETPLSRIFGTAARTTCGLEMWIYHSGLLVTNHHRNYVGKSNRFRAYFVHIKK